MKRLAIVRKAEATGPAFSHAARTPARPLPDSPSCARRPYRLSGDHRYAAVVEFRV